MNAKRWSLSIVIAAFLAGAFVSVLDPLQVNWNWMVPILGVGAVGLWRFRTALHREASADERLADNMAMLEQCLAAIRDNLEALCARAGDLPVYEARFEIDRLFRDDLNRFADARESMIHVFGMQQYADVMSAFAAGERYINRVWSASTDGYQQEVQTYLEKARNQFVEASGLFRMLRSQPGSQGAAPGR